MMVGSGRRSLLFGSLVFSLLAVPLALGLTPDESAAQLTPADSAAVLLATAAQFEREGRWEVAEAIYVLLTERYGSTPAGLEARRRLSASPSERPQRISRVELQVFGTLYGMWLGVAVPVALGADSPEAYGAGLLIGGPTGLFGSRAWLRAHPMSEGQARAISWGGIWGTWQGLGWAKALDIGVSQFCDSFGCYGNEDDIEEVFASMVVGGLVGIGTGAIIARNPVRSGVASGAQGGSTWGSIYGATVAEIVSDDGDAVLISSLVAGNVGLLAGAALAKKYDLSRGRIRVINLGALVGGIAGLGIDLLVQPNGDEPVLGIPLVTSLAGLGIAAYTTRDSDRDGGSPEDFGAALLSYDGGRLSLAPPIPMPALLPVDDHNGRTAWRPGLSVELFRARF